MACRASTSSSCCCRSCCCSLSILAAGVRSLLHAHCPAMPGCANRGTGIAPVPGTTADQPLQPAGRAGAEGGVERRAQAGGCGGARCPALQPQRAAHPRPAPSVERSSISPVQFSKSSIVHIWTTGRSSRTPAHGLSFFVLMHNVSSFGSARGCPGST